MLNLCLNYLQIYFTALCNAVEKKNLNLISFKCSLISPLTPRITCSHEIKNYKKLQASPHIQVLHRWIFTSQISSEKTHSCFLRFLSHWSVGDVNLVRGKSLSAQVTALENKDLYLSTKLVRHGHQGPQASYHCTLTLTWMGHSYRGEDISSSRPTHPWLLWWDCQPGGQSLWWF